MLLFFDFLIVYFLPVVDRFLDNGTSFPGLFLCDDEGWSKPEDVIVGGLTKQATVLQPMCNLFSIHIYIMMKSFVHTRTKCKVQSAHEWSPTKKGDLI